MRRLFVLALLLGGMRLIQPLGARGFGGQTLLAFGFLILAAYAAGELAVGLRIPKLVGYLVAGVAFGPSALGTIGERAIANLAPVSSLAIALIAFIAGAELRWDEVRARGGALLRVLGTELGFSLAAITTLLLALRPHISFLADASFAEAAAFSIVFGVMAAVHSPAVAIALLSETRARGPVAKTTLGLVLISDVVIVLLLTAALAVARVLVPPAGENAPALTVGAVAWEVLGAVVIGALLGALVAVYLRFVRRELFLFALMVAFFGAELAALLRVEPLLTLITTGFVVENISPSEHSDALRHALERAAAPVFVVFFALAGAEIALPQLARLWPLVLPLALVRGGAIWAGCRVGLRWSGVPSTERPALDRHLWAGLLPQAGVAIGLAAVVAQTYPRRGGDMRVLFLALVAVNQILGPILFRRALDRSGEISEPTVDASADEAPPALVMPEQS